MKDQKVWLIEEIKNSKDCMYKFSILFEKRCLKNKKFFGVKCSRETCPLKVGKS